MNARLIVQRRFELGLSRADLARLTGLSWTFLTMVEGTGEPPFVTLDAARRLARVLALDLDAVATTECPVEDPSPDDVRLERLLARTRAVHTESELAVAMDWTLPRAVEAAKRLERRLVGTGQALRTCAAGVQLTASGGEHATRDAARLGSSRTSPTRRQAELLRVVIIGTDRQRSGEDLDDEQRVIAAQLCDQGLIEPYRDQLRLTDRARYSLEPEIRQLRYRVGRSARQYAPTVGAGPDWRTHRRAVP